MIRAFVFFILCLALGVLIGFLITEFGPRHGTVVYDCSIAEISPDFPIEVKNQCRALRSQK